MNHKYIAVFMPSTNDTSPRARLCYRGNTVQRIMSDIRMDGREPADCHWFEMKQRIPFERKVTYTVKGEVVE